MLELNRRHFLATTTALGLAGYGNASNASDFPNRPIELIMPATPGGGTDMIGRAFADIAKKYLPQQPIIPINKPGASGAIGFNELIAAKPDGYKISMIFAELAIIPFIGLMKHTASDLKPLARFNADPAAITVRNDAPWKTFDEFLADAKKRTDKPVQIGNTGPGSIWHLAAAAFADKAGIKVDHVPYQGSAPAMQSLLGGHIDAVAISPGEVSRHVAAGTMRTLVVMGDQRQAGLFEKVPTLKERGVDLTVMTWRGLAVPKTTPKEIVDLLGDVARKVANDPAFKEALEKANLGWAYADATTFEAAIDRDRAMFKTLIAKLDLQNK